MRNGARADEISVCRLRRTRPGITSNKMSNAAKGAPGQPLRILIIISLLGGSSPAPCVTRDIAIPLQRAGKRLIAHGPAGNRKPAPWKFLSVLGQRASSGKNRVVHSG
jgi:hypothetical protein